VTIALQNSRVFGPFTRVLSDLASPRAAEQAWHAVGLPPDILDGPPVFLPYRLQAQVAEAAARNLGERHLGAMIAARFSYDDLDLYGAYVLDAPRLDQALLRGTRALRFILNRSTVHMREVERHLLLGFRSGIEEVSGSHHIDEGIPFLLIDLVRRFAGAEWVPAWIEMPRPRPPGNDRLAELYGAPVWYGRELPAVAIPTADLAATNPRPSAARSLTVLSDLRAMVRGGRRRPRSVSCARRCASSFGPGAHQLMGSRPGWGSVCVRCSAVFGSRGSVFATCETKCSPSGRPHCSPKPTDRSWR
jgi:hypothetical protein